MTRSAAPEPRPRIPRNLLAVSLGSFFTDISSEVIVHLLPLFLTNVLGAKTGVVGLIEGMAESAASLTRLFSGWLSDRLGKRKALTVKCPRTIPTAARSSRVAAGVRGPG